MMFFNRPINVWQHEIVKPAELFLSITEWETRGDVSQDEARNAACDKVS